MTEVTLTIDGAETVAPAAISVAAAVALAGRGRFRTSVSGEPRTPLCGMGICFECRVELDGVPHVRSCMRPVRHGMVVRTDA